MISCHHLAGRTPTISRLSQATTHHKNLPTTTLLHRVVRFLRLIHSVNLKGKRLIEQNILVEDRDSISQTERLDL